MKRIKTLRGFRIYEVSGKERQKAERDGLCMSKYHVFLPGESPDELFMPEFECDSLREAVDSIRAH